MSLVTVTVTSLKAYMVTPEDLLPGESTLALFSSAEEALIRQYEVWLPVLRSIPPSAFPRTIAVVDIPQEGPVIVLFARRPLPADIFPADNRWTRKDIGPLTVAASSPAIFPLLESPVSPLRSFRAYRRLSQEGKGDQAWIFAQSSLLPQPLSPADTLLNTLAVHGATHLSIAPSGQSGSVVRFFPANGPEDPAILPVAPADGSPSFSIALAHADTFWQELKESLSRTDRLTLEAKLLTLLASTFGEDVSLDYDVLPLLLAPSRLTLTVTASGSTAFLLQGRAEGAPERLAHLHDAFRGSLTTTRVVTRAFDKGRYVFRNIREDSAQIVDESFPLGSLQAHATSQTSGRGLYSATDGENYLLSNDRTLLGRSILRSQTMPGGPAMADGVLSRSAFATFFTLSPPLLLGPSSPLIPSSEQAIRWSWTRQGDVAIITINPD